MNQFPVLINGTAYAHAQIAATVAGVPVVSITEITYSETQEKVNNYGTGPRPVSRGHGKIESTGSLTIAMNEIEAIRDAAPQGSLLAVEAFDITITFLNAQKPVTHVLKSVEFTKDEVSSSEGDTDIKVSTEIIIGSINFR
jgi:hypothetical protein